MRCTVHGVVSCSLVLLVVFTGSLGGAEQGGAAVSPPPGAILAEAVEHLDSGKTVHAEILLERLTAAPPPWSGRAAYLLARVATTRKQWAAALVFLDRALPSLPVIGDHVLVERARALKESGRVEDAVVALAELRESFPRSPLVHDARMLEAELWIALSAGDKALDALAPLVAQRGPQVTVLAAKALILQGEVSKAVQGLKRVYIDHPGTLWADHAHAMLVEAGRFGLSRSEELRRASHLETSRRFGEAERIYRKWLRVDPGNNELRESLGSCLFRARRYREAAEELRKASGPEVAFLELRSRYRDSMTPDETLAAIDVVLQKFPDLAPRLYALRLQVARDFRRAGKVRRAEVLLQKVLEWYPGRRATTSWELGWTYLRADRFDDAARVLARLRSSDGDGQRPLYWRARLLEWMGQRPHALDLYRKIEGSPTPGYYGVLAATRSDETNSSDWKSRRESQRQSRQDALGESLHLQRIREFRLLGMTDEARAELSFLSQQTTGPDERLALAELSVDLGDYGRAIGIVGRLESSRNHRVLDCAYPRGFWEEVVRAARREGLDPYLVVAVIREESRFRRQAVSSAGAVGLMQLMPKTAVEHHRGAGVAKPSVADLKSSHVNIPVGVHYLSKLMARYGGDIFKSVAAYNAGEHAVDRWLAELGETAPDVFVEEIPYQETRRYVRKVLSSYRMYRLIWGLSPPQLFRMVQASYAPAGPQ